MGTPRESLRLRTNGTLVRFLLTLGIFAVLTFPATHASWIDTAPVTGTTITAGTVDLKVENSDSVTGYSSLDISLMEPGDSAAGFLTVRNSGTAPLLYYIDAAVTDQDARALGGSLVAKVTSDTEVTGTLPSARCAGAALAGTGTTFGPDLVGSSSSPRSLPGGTSQKLCIQVSLPEGSIAEVGTTSISFTARARTGSAAAPGWTDSVGVTGTTVRSATVFYLATNASSDSTYAGASRTLRRTGPTKTQLFNYDTDRDNQPGLVLNKGNGNPNIERFTLSPALTKALAVSGTATLRLWSAVKGFDPTAKGALTVGLYDCDSAGANCTMLSTTDHNPNEPWNSTGTWSRRTFTLVSGSYTFGVGRTLQLRLSATNLSGDDMLLAYDTTSYRSAIIVQ